MLDFIAILALIGFVIYVFWGIGSSVQEERDNSAALEEFSEKYLLGQEYKKTRRALVPVCSKDNGKWGLMTRSGYLVVPYQYMSIWEEDDCGGCWECHGDWDEKDYYDLNGNPISARKIEEERERIEREKQEEKEREERREAIEDAVFWTWAAHEYIKAEEEQESDDDDW